MKCNFVFLTNILRHLVRLVWNPTRIRLWRYLWVLLRYRLGFVRHWTWHDLYGAYEIFLVPRLRHWRTQDVLRQWYCWPYVGPLWQTADRLLDNRWRILKNTNLKWVNWPEKLEKGGGLYIIRNGTYRSVITTYFVIKIHLWFWRFCIGVLDRLVRSNWLDRRLFFGMVWCLHFDYISH